MATAEVEFDGAVARLEGVTVAYPTGVALADVDLALPRAATVAVIGPNGSGKSTLLGVIAGLVEPTAGTVEVDRSGVALVLQSTDVDPALPLTVRDAVRMARYPHRGLFGRFRADDHAAVEAAMARTEVAHLAGRQLRDLSGGQRQRALVAQGLAQEADLLLLDEPVTGLDVVTREALLRIVDEERDAGRTVVVTTHSLEDAARCDVVVLLAGRVVAAGPPGEVIVDEHLRAAFGSRVLLLPGGEVHLDDPHHHDH